MFVAPRKLTQLRKFCALADDDSAPNISDNYRDMWSAVLELAGAEATLNPELHSYVGERNVLKLIRNAQNWFNSKNQGVGSFLWICTVLDLDPNLTRTAMLNGDHKWMQ